MKFPIKNYLMMVLAAGGGIFASIVVSQCAMNSPGAGGFSNYGQVERVARPGINELLVMTNANLNLWNTFGPNLDLSGSSILAEISNVLTSFFAGICYADGVIGASYAPAQIPCPVTGSTVITGSALNTDVAASAITYVNAVQAAFIPDVMRINAYATSSGYTAVTCNVPGTPIMFCGGRQLSDNVVDMTLSFLFTGDYGATGTSNGAPTYEVSGGVYYCNSSSISGCAGSSSNSQQGHQPLLATFPYAAPPN